MANANFTRLTHSLAVAAINFGSDTFKAMLVTAIPSESNLDTWEDRADVTSEHAATGGYTAGGFSVTAGTPTVDTANNRTSVTYTCASPTYAGVTLAGVVGCIIYKSTGTAANDLLMHFVDFESTKGVTGGDFNVTFTAPLYISRQA